MRMEPEPLDQSGLGVIEVASEAERRPKPEIGPIPGVRSVGLSEEVDRLINMAEEEMAPTQPIVTSVDKHVARTELKRLLYMGESRFGLAQLD